MAVQRVRDEGQILKYPAGRVLGIVDTRADFERLVGALQRSGFEKIEALCGEEGVNLLERVGGFFFSDMEPRVLDRHIDEMKAGNIIVAIRTPNDRVDEAVAVASENGARRLVHFGLMTVTWLTK